MNPLQEVRVGASSANGLSGDAVIDHDAIARRIPHAGAMCLLDRVLTWSSEALACAITNHAAADHPLRGPTGLAAPCAIEYAAQAMALHGSLCAAQGEAPKPGFLVSARQVRLWQPWLDLAPGPLVVAVRRLAGAERQAAYGFTLHDADGNCLVEGRATVVLDTPLTAAKS